MPSTSLHPTDAEPVPRATFVADEGRPGVSPASGTRRIPPVYYQYNKTRKEVFAMNTSTRRTVAAIALVLLVLSAPLWVPTLQTLAAQNSKPGEGGSAFYVLDAGWTTKSLTQTVLAVPQVLAWSPSQEDPLWITETGFIYGGFRDAETRQIFITEQRNLDHESLQGVTFKGESYTIRSGWLLHLTTLDEKTGKVSSRTALDLPAYAQAAGGYSFHPIGISGDTLYLMNYASRDNLLAYDLTAKDLTGDSWSLCENGYLMQAGFLPAAIDLKIAGNASSSRVAAFCVDYSTGMQSWVTLTNLQTREQSSLELPQLGKEDYQTGNGMFTANGSVYAIDTDAGVLVEINLDNMQIVQTSHYRDGLAQGQSSWLDEVLSWIGNQIAIPAAAKRWTAMTAVSPDGRWLAVDGGFSASQGSSQELLIIDLQSLKATQSFELRQTPSQIIFGSDGQLLALFEKRTLARDIEGVLLNIETGEQQTISVPTHGWIYGVMSAD